MATITQTLKNTGVANATQGFIGDAFNVVAAVGAYKAGMEEGDHPAVAATKGIVNFAVGEMFYGGLYRAGIGIVGGFGVSLAMMGINTGVQLMANHMENTAQKLGQGTESVKGLGSGHFNMTQAGYTMRQRSLNAIRSNGANINSAFGNEARNYYLGL